MSIVWIFFSNNSSENPSVNISGESTGSSSENTSVNIFCEFKRIMKFLPEEKLFWRFLLKSFTAAEWSQAYMCGNFLQNFIRLTMKNSRIFLNFKVKFSDYKLSEIFFHLPRIFVLFNSTNAASKIQLESVQTFSVFHANI